MIGEHKYKYLDSNAPNIKINYSYSKYLGLEFLEYWKTSRKSNLKSFNKQKILKIIEELSNNKDVIGYTSSKKIFLNWLKNIEKSNKVNLVYIDLLVKRFEVTKKVFCEYNDLMRPKNKDKYLDVENYSLFGIVLGVLFSKTNKYQYLNAHVKINDILLGWNISNLTKNNSLLRSYSLDLEYKNVIEILNKKNISHD